MTLPPSRKPRTYYDLGKYASLITVLLGTLLIFDTFGVVKASMPPVSILFKELLVLTDENGELLPSAQMTTKQISKQSNDGFEYSEFIENPHLVEYYAGLTHGVVRTFRATGFKDTKVTTNVQGFFVYPLKNFFKKFFFPIESEINNSKSLSEEAKKKLTNYMPEIYLRVIKMEKDKQNKDDFETNLSSTDMVFYHYKAPLDIENDLMENRWQQIKTLYNRSKHFEISEDQFIALHQWNTSDIWGEEKIPESIIGVYLRGNRWIYLGEQSSGFTKPSTPQIFVGIDSWDSTKEISFIHYILNEYRMNMRNNNIK